LLTSDFEQLAALHCFNGRKYPRKQWSQVGHAVTNTGDQYDADIQSREVLLISQRPIGSDDDLETGISRCTEQHPIAQTQPFLRPNGGHIVFTKVGGPPDRQRLINENSQPR
jgi:hypothetical protein